MLRKRTSKIAPSVPSGSSCGDGHIRSPTVAELPEAMCSTANLAPQSIALKGELARAKMPRAGAIRDDEPFTGSAKFMETPGTKARKKYQPNKHNGLKWDCVMRADWG